MVDEGRMSSLLDSKRRATEYRILIEVAQHQPAISQQEIADEIGVTSQAVSNYLTELVERGFVVKHRRSRYEITNEGVNWLISVTDELQQLLEYVTAEVIEDVDVESALASADIEESQQVSLSMEDGYLHASPGECGEATAMAVTDAEAGRDVAISDFEGVLDYGLGTLTIVSVPSVRNGGSAAVDIDVVGEQADTVDRIAVAGAEAVATARRVGLEPDIRFGTPEAVLEAAEKGLDVLLLAVEDEVSRQTDRLREGTVTYEQVDATAGE